MPLLFGHDAEVAAWVEGKMQGRFVFPHIAIGMLDPQGVLRGAFVLCVHNIRTAELTLYSEGVVTNGMWKQFFRFVFRDLELARLQIRTDRRNKTVKKAAPKFGFRFEGVARDFWGPGEDALLYYMSPAMCRWIRNDHGIALLFSQAAKADQPAEGRAAAA